MPIEIDKRKGIFRIKEIWFADDLYDRKDCDLLIFRATRRKIERPGFLRNDLATLTIDLTQPLETIWKKMDEKSCRYSIKRAEREGILVRQAVFKDYKKFYDLVKHFNRQKKLPSPGPRDIGLWQKHGTLFIAQSQGNMLAGNLYFADDNSIRWIVGASKRFEAGINVSSIGWANSLLIWEAIKYAKQKGIKEFDLGGCYVGQDKNNPRYSITLFKEKFAGVLRADYTYHRYYGLYNFLRKAYHRIRALHG
ncbi:MAG: hypothetical protein HZB36_04365 [Candidatus Omnitrophica bacterium]|nr:hypothetical protein [Candidatus Omnitrophota bacterium]